MTDAIGAITTGATPDTSIQNATVGAAGAPFVRAVVLQTLNDPATRDATADQAIISTLANSDLYFRAPRNSIICRIISNREGLNNVNLVCFPFFSSHFMMPVKAGELVWLFMELPTRPFWISRIPAPLHVEDTNFTHFDRQYNRNFKGPNDPKTNNPFDDGSGNFDNPRKLKFQNGDPSKTEQTATISGGQNAFVSIITGSKEYPLTSLEPVPRLTKRPGDLVLQGSNNTAIRLGTEMGWTVDAAGRPTATNEKSQASTISTGEKLETGLGAIDIVAGRGRYFQSNATEKDSTRSKKERGEKDANTTRPFIEETVIDGAFEVDKNVGTVQSEAVSNSKGNSRTNPQEGDPDFLMDASRLYISSKSEIDKILGTGPNGVAKAFENPVADQTGPSIAVKSDHIRIVARKSPLQNRSSIEPADIGNLNPPSNGSIRIVKEGEPNGDLATITIEPDGTIQISGSKIFLGRKTDDGGVGTGPGAGESQPYVRYQQLEDLLNATCQAVIDFATSLKANFLANTTPGFGGPNPALIASANAECQKLINDINDIKNNKIETLKSERIFGE